MVEQLSDSFKRDASLKSMQDLHLYIKNQTPHLLAKHDIPQKRELVRETKRNEEQELEEALKLSILEYEKSSAQPTASNNGADASEESKSERPSTNPGPPVVRKVRALHDLVGRGSDELSFRKGDVIRVMEQVYRDWWRGSLRGKIGIFPLNYVTPVTDKTLEEICAEKRQEDAILSQYNKVNELHQTMRAGSNDVNLTQDPQVNDLYSTCLLYTSRCV